MTIGSVGRIIKRSLFTKTSKEILLFIFFVGLSGIFWLSLTLNETYEKDFAVPVSIADIPKNAVLTSEEVDTIHVTIRDKGLLLVGYKYGDALRHFRLPFRNYTFNNGSGVVPASEIQKYIYRNLSSSSKITSIKPDKLEFFYSSPSPSTRRRRSSTASAWSIPSSSTTPTSATR